MGAKHKEPISTWVDEQISSYFDINQLELACINRVLEGKEYKLKNQVNIGKTKRILGIQKKNLEHLLARTKKAHGKKDLDRELAMILAGRKSIPFACMMFQE